MENSLQNGLVVTLIGIAIVFLGLTILIGLIKVMTLVIEKMTGRKDKKAAAPAPAPVKAEPAPAVEELPEEEDEGEVVAAIMAALSCVMGGQKGSFRVRRIRRV